jgi:hypothetical protein
MRFLSNAFINPIGTLAIQTDPEAIIQEENNLEDCSGTRDAVARCCICLASR